MITIFLIITGIIGFCLGFIYSITSPKIEPADRISKIESVVNSYRLQYMNKFGKTYTHSTFALINGLFYLIPTLCVTYLLPIQLARIVPIVSLSLMCNRIKTYSEFRSLDLEHCLGRSLF